VPTSTWARHARDSESGDHRWFTAAARSIGRGKAATSSG
jgi:hypothetical protein